jgi:hypothetical protein
MSSPVSIETSSGSLTMNVGGSATFNGFTTIATGGGAGDLTILAGQNLSFLANTSVQAKTSLTLVCDNKFLNPPQLGPGAFQLLEGATLSGPPGMPLRIFTAKRTQNLIAAEINGNPFVPGKEFVNSATEEWGVYYFNSFGGDPFTIFYKNIQKEAPAYFTFVPPFSLFFDLNPLDQFVYFDWCRWSDFLTTRKQSTSLFKGKEVIWENGHSLRKRREEFLKNVHLRGFP